MAVSRVCHRDDTKMSTGFVIECDLMVAKHCLFIVAMRGQYRGF